MRSRIRLVAIGALGVVLVAGAVLWWASDGTGTHETDRKIAARGAPTTTTSTSTTTTTEQLLLPPQSVSTTAPRSAAPPPAPAPPHISTNTTSIPMTTSTSTYTTLVFVKNDGGVAVTVTASSGGGYFSVQSHCPNPLGVGAQCQVDITFGGASAPAGTYSTTLQISAAGGNTIAISVTATDTY